MVFLFFYLAVIFSLLIFLIFFSIYTAFLIYSAIRGSPFVSTNKKKLPAILAAAGLKKNKVFIDLGCGDGRVVITAVSNFKVKGVGVEINPILLKIASIKAKLKKLSSEDIQFICQDLLLANISFADYIYLFLMPDLIRKLKPKLEKELKKNAIIISHGFKIEGWERKLIKTLEDKPFCTFYYRQ